MPDTDDWSSGVKIVKGKRCINRRTNLKPTKPDDLPYWQRVTKINIQDDTSRVGKLDIGQIVSNACGSLENLLDFDALVNFTELFNAFHDLQPQGYWDDWKELKLDSIIHTDLSSANTRAAVPPHHHNLLELLK